MFSFGIHFLICNVFISLILAGILLAKKLLRTHLSGRTSYQIWILLLMLFIMPFLSIRPTSITQFVAWFSIFKNDDMPRVITNHTIYSTPSSVTNWIHDFHISVTHKAPSLWYYLPFVVWCLGMFAMILFMFWSRMHLYRLEKSALPLQNVKVKKLFVTCILEMQLRRNIPIYSTAFLKSPIMVGLFRPRIYIPIHLISDYNAHEMRYILLHELQHYKHKDAWINLLINLSVIVYWFNPLVWYILKEVRADREVACDSSVLEMLRPEDYTNYGNTLLNFAEKISLCPFSFTTGIGSSAKQLKKRILNIVSYQPKTGWHKYKEHVLFLLMAVLVFESTTFIPVLAADENISFPADAIIELEDLSSFFSGYNGCFVFYDLGKDIWKIYNEPLATKRVSPNSTYKIYSALSALEHHYITPDATAMDWDGQIYAFSKWNQPQTLTSAIQNSVNWYFQSLDQAVGLTDLEQFYQSIGYGNQDLSGGISEYWMESSLKISAFEQVELLKKLYTNEFHFQEQNIQTVKQALFLSSSEHTAFYGKTGTGNINGHSINGWFIGYVETENNTYFFATNIQGTDHADGLTASEITKRIFKMKGFCY